MPTLHEEVVNHMMENDYFSQWMGVEVIDVKEGYSKIKMTIRKEMVNGFGIVHGGLPFSLVDSEKGKPPCTMPKPFTISLRMVIFILLYPSFTSITSTPIH